MTNHLFIVIIESVTVKTSRSLSRPAIRSLLASAAVFLTAATFANAGNIPEISHQTQTVVASYLGLARLALLPQITVMFPIVGLLVAAWATQHVRRRNARQLAANKQ